MNVTFLEHNYIFQRTTVSTSEDKDAKNESIYLKKNVMTSNQKYEEIKPSLKPSLVKPFYRRLEIISLEILPDIF